jgi:hypothetical protein
VLVVEGWVEQNHVSGRARFGGEWESVGVGWWSGRARFGGEWEWERVGGGVEGKVWWRVGEGEGGLVELPMEV